jgi:hypothetical protein
MQQRYYLSRYLKRPILHYWLIPYIVKFCVKKSKKKRKKFYQSRHYPEEKNNFEVYLKYFVKGRRLDVKPILNRYYHN